MKRGCTTPSFTVPGLCLENCTDTPVNLQVYFWQSGWQTALAVTMVTRVAIIIHRKKDWNFNDDMFDFDFCSFRTRKLILSFLRFISMYTIINQIFQMTHDDKKVVHSFGTNKHRV